MLDLPQACPSMETHAGTVHGQSRGGSLGSAEPTAHGAAQHQELPTQPLPPWEGASRAGSRGWFAMRTASPGGTGHPGGFACSPRSNSEHEWRVAIGTSLNTVTLETTAARSPGARVRPCAPPVGVPDPAPRLQMAACPVRRSRCHVGPVGTWMGTDLSSQVALHHPQYHQSSCNHHQDQSRESRSIYSPVDQLGHRHLCLEVGNEWISILSHPTGH